MPAVQVYLGRLTENKSNGLTDGRPMDAHYEFWGEVQGGKVHFNASVPHSYRTNLSVSVGQSINMQLCTSNV